MTFISVMTGLDPVIHAFPRDDCQERCANLSVLDHIGIFSPTAWMTGSSPVMTVYRP